MEKDSLIRYGEPDPDGDVFLEGSINGVKIAIVGMGRGMVHSKSLARSMAVKMLMEENPDLKIVMTKEMSEDLGLRADVIIIDEGGVPEIENTFPDLLPKIKYVPKLNEKPKKFYDKFVNRKK